MTRKEIRPFGSKLEFAEFGRNTLAYVRRMNSDDMMSRFPETADLPEGVDLWALFSANGEPLAVADEEALLIDNAQERSLLTVARQ